MMVAVWLGSAALGFQLAYTVMPEGCQVDEEEDSFADDGKGTEPSTLPKVFTLSSRGRKS